MNGGAAVRADDAALFHGFSARIHSFRSSGASWCGAGLRSVRRPGGEWGDNDANRSVRKALNEDLTKLGELYAKRSQRIYRKSMQRIARTAWLVAITAMSRAAGRGSRRGDHLARGRASARRHYPLTEDVAAGTWSKRSLTAIGATKSARSHARSSFPGNHAQERGTQQNGPRRRAARARRQEAVVGGDRPLRGRSRGTLSRARPHIRSDAHRRPPAGSRARRTTPPRAPTERPLPPPPTPLPMCETLLRPPTSLPPP